MNGSPYLPIPATLEEIVEETPTIKTFVVRPSEPMRFEAGQFIALTVPGCGEAPFTPSSSPAEADRIEVTIMRVGRVTEQLHSLAPGAALGIRGPFGKPYPLDQFRGREVLIVGGGVGLAPLRALLFALFGEAGAYAKIILRYGARTPSDIVYRQAVTAGWGKNGLLDVMLTVDSADDTWEGNEGVVTTILENDKLTCCPETGVAVVCGPPVMMKFAAFKLLDRGYPPESVYLSMEKNMSCGVGKCGHCRLGRLYACKDGPVLTFAQVRGESKVFD